MKIFYFLIIAMLILFLGCSKEQTIGEEQIIEEETKEVIPMAKTLLIIAPSNFKDEEYFTPKKVLEDNGIEVITASLKSEATSVAGKKKKVDINILSSIFLHPIYGKINHFSL